MVNDKNDVEKTDNRILSLITNNKEVTIKELAVLAGKSTRTVARAIKKLKDNDKIKRIDSDKTGYWEVLQMCCGLVIK